MKKEKSKPAKTHKSEVLNAFFSVSDKDEHEKTEKNMLLAMRIEKAMKEKGYNKVQFAAAMKVQPSVITKWLSGTHNFTLDTLFDIEKELSMSLINTSEPSNIQTINSSYVTVVAIVHNVYSHLFYPNCSPQKELLKVSGQNLMLHG
jgi:ribosome-binding protein aMBF1 (putative translation factor)